jgi:hypothetical protein
MYIQGPKQTIDFNTDPILNDINNIVKDGLTKLLSQYLNRYELLERTHQAIMNLPSVVYELTNRTESHNCVSPVIEEKQNEKDLQAMISANENLLARVDILSKENEELTNELRELKKQLFHHTTDLSFDEVQIKVEPGVTVDSVEKENIRLEIEEQDVQDEEEDDSDSQEDSEEEDVDEEEDAVEEEENVDESDNAEDILETDEADETDDVLEAQHVQEEVVDEQEDDVEEEDEQEAEESVEEDVEQEEVVEEDDVQEAEESVETEKSDSEEEQEESVEEDEDEEIFEIDIDDVTYCTNNEENGFIYELNDGEMGDKIGYLKDGEPFFYADEN